MANNTHSFTDRLFVLFEDISLVAHVM